jgi:hypothetical protein
MSLRGEYSILPTGYILKNIYMKKGFYDEADKWKRMVTTNVIRRKGQFLIRRYIRTAIKYTSTKNKSAIFNMMKGSIKHAVKQRY